MKECEGDEPPDHYGRGKTQCELAARPGEEGGIGAPRFGRRRRPRNGHSNKGFGKPDRHPGTRSRLPRGKERCGKSGHPHGHAAPAWQGSKFRGGLHGFADIPKMVRGTGINGNGLVTDGPMRTGRSHGNKDTRGRKLCQVLYDIKLEAPCRAFRYLPRTAFQRMRNTSRNICTLSRNMFTLVAGEWAHRTGTSLIESP